MFEQDIAALPIRLAIRLVLDSVSYSNALPEWFEPLTVDYVRREATIGETIQRYLNGTEKPQRPFEVSVPKRLATATTWIVPPVNDQIVWQAAVSSIADALQQKRIDQSKVFSCILNIDPNRLAFLNDQVKAWALFQGETERRTASGQSVLQFDLKDAYQSIGIRSFLAFLESATANRVAVRLLEVLLTASTPGGQGLPLLNDSLFFLGNAYLSEIDKIVSAQTGDFIRFVDDYRIFGASKAALERMLPALRAQLRTAGFELNESKLRVGSSEEYLEAVSKFRYAQIDASEIRYIDTAVPQPDIFGAEDMHAQIVKSLDNPEDYLHQGFGRLLMAAVRRMRVRGIFAGVQGYERTPWVDFSKTLAGDGSVVTKICDVLDQYSQEGSAVWRLLWVLYLSKDLEAGSIADHKLSARLRNTLQQVSQSTNLPPLVRQWASTPGYPATNTPMKQIEDLHRLSYLERGATLYGSLKGATRRGFLSVAGAGLSAVGFGTLARQTSHAPHATQSFFVAGVRFQKRLRRLGRSRRVKLGCEYFRGQKCYAVLTSTGERIGYVPVHVVASWKGVVPLDAWLSHVHYDAVPWRRFELTVMFRP